MPYLATFGRVHNFTCKHRLNVLCNTLFRRDGVEKSQSLNINLGVGKVKDDAITDLLTKGSVALFILEQVTEVRPACHSIIVLLESLNTGSLFKSCSLDHEERFVDSIDCN